MAKTRGGHNYRPRVRPSFTPPTGALPPTTGPSAANPTAVHAVGLSIPTTATSNEAPAPVPATPASRRYDTQVEPASPSLPYPGPSRRALPPKRARTFDPGESYS